MKEKSLAIDSIEEKSVEGVLVLKADPVNVTKIKDTKEVDLLLNQARTVIIGNNDQYEFWTQLLKNIKGKMKDEESDRVRMGGPFKKIVDTVNGYFKARMTVLEKAESVIKSAIFTYSKKLQEIAAKQQEEIRQKQLKEAAALQKKADKIQEKSPEKAEELRFQAQVKETVVPVIPEAPKIKGIGTMKTWYAIVKNKEVLFKYVMDNPSCEYVIVNEKLLNKMARATQGKAIIPGVIFNQKEGITADAE